MIQNKQQKSRKYRTVPELLPSGVRWRPDAWRQNLRVVCIFGTSSDFLSFSSVSRQFLLNTSRALVNIKMTQLMLINIIGRYTKV